MGNHASPKNISTNTSPTAVADFYEHACNFCSLIDTTSSVDQDIAANILSSMLDIYREILRLPQNEAADYDPPCNFFAPTKLSFGIQDCYWEIHDPTHLDEPVCGSLYDDCLEIYKILKNGCLLYESENTAEAADYWKLEFGNHGKYHAADAIRALTFILDK